jgi:hypothetical protein
MTLRQKQNLFIYTGIAAIVILIISYHQKIYLPLRQKEKLVAYQKWIDNIDETLILETDFLTKSHEYKEQDKYMIHDVTVERIKDKSSKTNNYFYSDSVKFSLSEVMEIVYQCCPVKVFKMG